jgi:Golgi nucleoside diphosphatase
MRQKGRVAKQQLLTAVYERLQRLRARRRTVCDLIKIIEEAVNAGALPAPMTEVMRGLETEGAGFLRSQNNAELRKISSSVKQQDIKAGYRSPPSKRVQ